MAPLEKRDQMLVVFSTFTKQKMFLFGPPALVLPFSLPVRTLAVVDGVEGHDPPARALVQRLAQRRPVGAGAQHPVRDHQGRAGAGAGLRVVVLVVQGGRSEAGGGKQPSRGGGRKGRAKAPPKESAKKHLEEGGEITASSVKASSTYVLFVASTVDYILFLFVSGVLSLLIQDAGLISYYRIVVVVVAAA